MTSVAVASLQAPVLDQDTMELSTSPARGSYDNDLDLDIFDYENVPIADDDRMVDDADHPRPATATDEMMDDDDHVGMPTVVEEVMSDGPAYDTTHQEAEDEDLVDFDDEIEYNDEAFNFDSAAITQNPDTAFPPDAAVAITEEEVDDETLRLVDVDNASETADVAAASELPTEVALEAAALAPEAESAPIEQISLEAASAEQFVQPDEEYTTHEQPEAENIEGDGSAIADQDAEEEEPLKPVAQVPGSLDTNLTHVPDGPPTPTDTGLHPMTLRFREYEMPLFKSRNQTDGLLKDDNLANLSLATLIQSCRERLVKKFGEQIEEGQDLMLVFDHMKLVLFEECRAASATSLNDVVDVYLQLHRNDGTEEIPPLALALQIQPFAGTFTNLKQLAAQGTGMSFFRDTWNPEDEASTRDEAFPAAEDQAHDDDDDGEQSIVPDESAVGPLQETETQDFAEDEYQYEDEQNEYHVDPEGESGEHFPGQDLQDGLDVENHQDPSPYLENGDHEEYPDPDEELQAYEDAGSYEEGALEDGQINSVDDHVSRDVTQPDSAASSETARGDPANDVTGEYYEEDLIDWEEEDEEDLTPFSSELNAEDGNEDYSTLLTDHEAEAVHEVSDPGLDKPVYESQAGAEEAADSIGDDQANDEFDLNLGSEDFLNEDFAENPEDLQAAEDVFQYDDDAGTDPTQCEQDDYTHTDNVDDDAHQGVDFSEDTEQFHTALDLADGDDQDGSFPHGEIGNSGQAEGPKHDSDYINFDDEDDEYGDDAAAEPTATPNSPLGKRSFEEHADEDEIDFDEPDPKKARA